MEEYPALLLRWSVQGLLALAAMTFVIQWILPRLNKFFRLRQKTRAANEDTLRGDNSTDERKERMRERLQKQHEEKANSYMERILIPREENKRKQKEKKFEQFTGPAWKGKGNPLGSDEMDKGQDDEIDKETPDNQQAARRRKLQLSDNSENQSIPAKELKMKKVIQLPEEPLMGVENSITVKLRTPVGNIHQRRFLHTHTVQVLMEYMTTLGFKQSFYTISTSYPRLNLADFLNKALWEMGFKGQITLNVEEKEES